MASLSPFPNISLYQRALSDASSLTPTECNTIRNRPPPEEEDAICISLAGVPLRSLIEKALALAPAASASTTTSHPASAQPSSSSSPSPNSPSPSNTTITSPPPPLTKLEAKIVAYGPAYLRRTRAEQAAHLAPYRQLSDAQRDLVDQAGAAVANAEDNRARNYAWKVLRRFEEEERAAKRREREEGRRNEGREAKGGDALHPSSTTHIQNLVFPWEKDNWARLVASENWSRWGLIVLRTAYPSSSSSSPGSASSITGRNDSVTAPTTSTTITTKVTTPTPTEDSPTQPWSLLKQNLSTIAAAQLRRTAPPSEAHIADSFCLKFVDDETELADASLATVRRYVARLLQREGQAEERYFGARCFLVCNAGVLEAVAEGERRGIRGGFSVLVLEREGREMEGRWEDEEEEDGWKGGLYMQAELVFALLVPNLARGERRPLRALDLLAQAP